MTDTTERPPAREVLSPERVLMDVYFRYTSGHVYWTATDFSHAILTALTRAGYPVEALPALVEALEALLSAGTGTPEMGKAHVKGRAALALAKEPKP